MGHTKDIQVFTTVERTYFALCFKYFYVFKCPNPSAVQYVHNTTLQLFNLLTRLLLLLLCSVILSAPLNFVWRDKITVNDIYREKWSFTAQKAHFFNIRQITKCVHKSVPIMNAINKRHRSFSAMKPVCFYRIF